MSTSRSVSSPGQVVGAFVYPRGAFREPRLRRVAQLVEQRSPKPPDAGSSPAASAALEVTVRGDFLSHCPATGKRMYADRRTASRIARLHHEHLSVYRCDECRYFHVGHLPRDVIHGAVSRTDLYRPVQHARGDDQAPEMDQLERLQAARQMILTGRRRIRGVDRDAAVARLDAEITRVAALVTV